MTDATGMGRGRKLALFGIALAAGIAAGGACAQTADRAPAAGKPAATHPVTRPAVTRPAVTRPAVSRPAATRPAVAKHAPAQKAGPAKTAKPAAAAKPRKPAPPTSPVWLCRAASNGNTLAAFLLGRLYLTGAGVPLSPELGAAWLRVARERGNADAAQLLDSIGPTTPVRPACGKDAVAIPLPVPPAPAVPSPPQPAASSAGQPPSPSAISPAAPPAPAPKEAPPPADPGLMGAGAHWSALGTLPGMRGNGLPRGMANDMPAALPARFVSPVFRQRPPGAAGIGRLGLGTDAPAAVREIVNRHAVELNLDPDLVLAMISVESRFRPDAVSPKNAAGLMQLIPATAQRFGVVDVFDPEDNIRGGMRYLRWLLDNFQGDVTKAVAAYNAGEGAVEQHGGVPPYQETRDYVRRIRAAYPQDWLPFNTPYDSGQPAGSRPAASRTPQAWAPQAAPPQAWTSPAWTAQWAMQGRAAGGLASGATYGGTGFATAARPVSDTLSPWLP
ncbi:lytic transglycosylase domain-containing protein [Azospirillum thiophilum]|uniref:lytic transglycosylase domain-containing protein n=1 Tax=Azospirillum thiophilum TaxID=528244 RepID=UPI001FE0D0F2|nr:lytic transglycosylase domain-containing protein [Azospirillum thiophilum]